MAQNNICAAGYRPGYHAIVETVARKNLSLCYAPIIMDDIRTSRMVKKSIWTMLMAALNMQRWLAGEHRDVHIVSVALTCSGGRRCCTGTRETCPERRLVQILYPVAALT
jgi:hypothetical protein